MGFGRVRPANLEASRTLNTMFAGKAAVIVFSGAGQGGFSKDIVSSQMSNPLFRPDFDT